MSAHLLRIFRLEDASPLDADQTGQGFYIYRFNATATDQGMTYLDCSCFNIQSYKQQICT